MRRKSDLNRDTKYTYNITQHTVDQYTEKYNSIAEYLNQFEKGTKTLLRKINRTNQVLQLAKNNKNIEIAPSEFLNTHRTNKR